MTSYEIAKIIHMSAALLSGAGFLLRGALYLRDNPAPRSKLLKIAPHVVDTVLLASALFLAISLQLSPGQAPWLMAKIIGLLAYIGLGLVAFRFGKRNGVRRGAFVAALVCFGYIVAVAASKSPTL